jgi:hypothetical protein
MGVMAATVIAVARIAGPILTALSDRLLDSIERQTLTIDRLGEIAASMDRRLIIVEQQNNMLQDLIHGLIWPGHETLEEDPAPRPSRARKPVGAIAVPNGQERFGAERRVSERRVGDRRAAEGSNGGGSPVGSH